MKVRKPVVSGRFYPAEKESLISQIETIRDSELGNINLNLKKNHIIGGVVPHAGYMFSAYQAIHFFEIVKQSNQKIDTVVIINPNHTGYGHEIAIDDNDYWETPFGQIAIDNELKKELGVKISGIEQRNEHSGEVMLPFLQYFLGTNYKIVPITLSNQTFQNAKFLAERIFESAKKLKRQVLLIASSDFSHFLSPEEGKKYDALVIEKIKRLESIEVEKIIKEHRISVCGYGPIMVLIEYSKLFTQNPNVNILKVGHSGEVIPSNEVVDYVSILFSTAKEG